MGRGKAKWNKTAKDHPMGFKGQISSEEIRVPVEKYSNNHDISPNYPLFIKDEKEKSLLLEGKKYELI